jgi:hypothetical protein
MSPLAVLAVSSRGETVVSAQLILNRGNTSLQCGHTYREAAGFLARHPGAIILCKGWSAGNRADWISRLIGEADPSALILVTHPDENRISVEVRLMRNDDVLRDLVENPEMMRKIQVAWEYCEATCGAQTSLDEYAMGLPRM